VTVTKSKPPGLNVGFAALDSLQEGATIDPGATQTLHLQFAPQTPGSAADQWVINADGAQGVLTVGLHGQGQAGAGNSSSGCSTTGAATLWPLLALLPWAARRRRVRQS
jgi:Synergist-CTERM protein sorting domain-containing protein